MRVNARLLVGVVLTSSHPDGVPALCERLRHASFEASFGT